MKEKQEQNIGRSAMRKFQEWGMRVHPTTLLILETAFIVLCLTIIGPLAIVYLMPSVLASTTDVPNQKNILKANLLIGWTVIGWVVVLTWFVWKWMSPGFRRYEGPRRNLN